MRASTPCYAQARRRAPVTGNVTAKEPNVGYRSDYEESAHRQIEEWKNPEQSWFDKAMVVVSWPLDTAGQ